MIERGPIAERLINPELPSSAGHFAGLHPRMLMGGDFLNPATQIETVTAQQLGNFSQRDYAPFSNASARERKAYWDQRNEAAYEARYQAWITGCVSTFEGAKTFFKDTEKGKSWSELYAKLGIDTQNFTSQTAEGLYNGYFQNDNLGIKQFVEDMLSFHTSENKVNIAELEANIDAIGWLSNIFGSASSEAITHMVMAEARLASDPDQLINQANSRQTANMPARVNNLNTDEQRILNFVWEAPRQPAEEETPEEPSGQPVSEENWQFIYERPGDPRTFPKEENIEEHLLSPAKVAAALRANPEKYGHISQEQLTQEVAQEQAEFEAWRNEIGLNNDYLRQVILEKLNDYESFLNRKYGVNLPRINYVQLVPISGKTAEAFGHEEGRFAFVDSRRPAIFMDFDTIADFAEGLGRAEHKAKTGIPLLREMTAEEITGLVVRLLSEINPHEYSHLTGDMAFWKIIQKVGDQEEQEWVTGKGGLRVAKPVLFKHNNQTQVGMRERGRGLNEAVTVELTHEWAQNMEERHELDIPAYEAERRVMRSLRNLLAREQGISIDEAFKKIAVGYFNPQGFRHLVEELSGKAVNPNIIGKGRITFKRPHFMQIVYALMEYEQLKAQQIPAHSNFAATIQFINYADKLSSASAFLKGELTSLVKLSKRVNSPVDLSDRAIRYLTEQGVVPVEYK